MDWWEELAKIEVERNRAQLEHASPKTNPADYLPFTGQTPTVPNEDIPLAQSNPEDWVPGAGTVKAGLAKALGLVPAIGGMLIKHPWADAESMLALLDPAEKALMKHRMEDAFAASQASGYEYSTTGIKNLASGKHLATAMNTSRSKTSVNPAWPMLQPEDVYKYTTSPHNAPVENAVYHMHTHPSSSGGQYTGTPIPSINDVGHNQALYTGDFGQNFLGFPLGPRVHAKDTVKNVEDVIRSPSGYLWTTNKNTNPFGDLFNSAFTDNREFNIEQQLNHTRNLMDAARNNELDLQYWMPPDLEHMINNVDAKSFWNTYMYGRKKP